MYIKDEMQSRLNHWEASGGTIAAIDAIALIESGRAKQCDIVIGIIAPKDTRIVRIMKRDGISSAHAEMRINAQKPDSFYIDNCDHTLENKYDSAEAFECVCKQFFEALIKNSTK